MAPDTGNDLPSFMIDFEVVERIKVAQQAIELSLCSRTLKQFCDHRANYQYLSSVEETPELQTVARFR